MNNFSVLYWNVGDLIGPYKISIETELPILVKRYRPAVIALAECDPKNTCSISGQRGLGKWVGSPNVCKRLAGYSDWYVTWSYHCGNLGAGGGGNTSNMAFCVCDPLSVDIRGNEEGYFFLDLMHPLGSGLVQLAHIKSRRYKKGMFGDRSWVERMAQDYFVNNPFCLAGDINTEPLSVCRAHQNTAKLAALISDPIWDDPILGLRTQKPGDLEYPTFHYKKRLDWGVGPSCLIHNCSTSLGMIDHRPVFVGL